MTKVAKLWKRITFWNKVRMLLGTVGIGSEVSLYLAESFPHWKVYAALATVGAISITYFIKDENNNGLVDAFERKRNKK